MTKCPRETNLKERKLFKRLSEKELKTFVGSWFRNIDTLGMNE